ncbi:MAG: hypothetical protein FWF25_02805 [Propionibacteriaceae bacterium]|nr:hypothetical protein [Propionibacteriaceae bacterium]
MILVPDDLTALNPDLPVDQALVMITDAQAQATLVAPCLADESGLSDAQLAQAKSVLRGIVLRWAAAGPAANVVTTSSMLTGGPYTKQESETVDNTQRRKGLFWPSEVEMLQRICQTKRRAGMVDVSPASRVVRRGEFHTLSGV